MKFEELLLWKSFPPFLDLDVHTWMVFVFKYQMSKENAIFCSPINTIS